MALPVDLEGEAHDRIVVDLDARVPDAKHQRLCRPPGTAQLTSSALAADAVGQGTTALAHQQGHQQRPQEAISRNAPVGTERPKPNDHDMASIHQHHPRQRPLSAILPSRKVSASEHDGRDPQTEGQGEARESSVADGQPSAGEEATPVSAAETLEEALERPPDAGPAGAYLQRAQLAEDRLGEVLAAFRVLKAENEGHRERVTRNAERRFQQQHEALLIKFIEVLDNFDRALEAAEHTYAGEPLVDGLILVRTQLLQILREEGLERIPALGLPFDPHHSEAVEAREVGEPEKHGLVIEEMLRGYRLNDTIARPAKVVVGRYGSSVADAEAAADPGDDVPGAD